MVVSLLAVIYHAVKGELPEVDPTQPAKLIPLRAAANNLSRCEGHFRALGVYRQLGRRCPTSELLIRSYPPGDFWGVQTTLHHSRCLVGTLAGFQD